MYFHTTRRHKYKTRRFCHQQQVISSRLHEEIICQILTNYRKWPTSSLCGMGLRTWSTWTGNTVLPSRWQPYPKHEVDSQMPIPMSLPCTSSPQRTWTCHQLTAVSICNGCDNESCYFLQQHPVHQPWHQGHPFPGQRSQHSVNRDVCKTCFLSTRSMKKATRGAQLLSQRRLVHHTQYTRESGNARRADYQSSSVAKNSLLTSTLYLSCWLYLSDSSYIFPK